MERGSNLPVCSFASLLIWRRRPIIIPNPITTAAPGPGTIGIAPVPGPWFAIAWVAVSSGEPVGPVPYCTNIPSAKPETLELELVNDTVRVE